MVFKVGDAVGCGAGVMAWEEAGAGGLTGVVEDLTLVTALGACGASAGLEGRATALGITAGAALAVEGVLASEADLAAGAFASTGLTADLAGFARGLGAGLVTALAGGLAAGLATGLAAGLEAGLGATLAAGLAAFAFFTAGTDRGADLLGGDLLEVAGFKVEAAALLDAFAFSAGFDADLAGAPADVFADVFAGGLFLLTEAFTSFLLWALACG